MHVLFFSIEDWANVGQTYARALKKVGVSAKAFSMHPSPYKYPDKEECYASFSRLHDVIEKADVIVLMHSHPDHMKLPFDLSKKKVAVFHGGTQYRNSPEAMNAVFNPVVDISLVQTGDLLDLGAKNQKWVLAGIDTDRIRPRKIKTTSKNPSKLIISHYPRESVLKGTIFIENAIQRLKRKHKNFTFYTNTDKEPWKKNLDRVAKCDIYIDAMQRTIAGKPYGEWGIQALEAAALGKIVVTHFLSRDRYSREYLPKGGDQEFITNLTTPGCPLVSVNSETELYEKLKILVTLHPDSLKKLQKQTRDWVVQYHSLKALGQRLVDALELNDEG